LQDKFHPEILTGSFKRYAIHPKLLLMTNRKLYMRLRLAPRSMIWMTLNCL